MKKIFFSVMAIVALAFTTSCDKTGKDAPEPVDPVALATPVLTVSNQVEDGFTVSWNAVENAAGYTYHMGQETVITETSVTFSDLDPGSYTVRVKANAPADSKEFTDSPFADVTVTLEAPAPEVSFTQELYTTDDYAAEGLTSANSLFFTWAGEAVSAVEYLLLSEEEGGGMDIEEAYDTYEFNYVDQANIIDGINAGGVELYFQNLSPATKYYLYAIAYDATLDNAVFDVDNCTTSEMEENPARDAWLGEWTLTADQALIWEVGADGNLAPRFEDREWTLDLTVEADPTYPNQVYIYGLTRSNMSDAPALAVIDENGDMAIYNQVAVGSADADGYTPTWLSYCSYGESGYTFVTGQFPAYTFAMDGDFADGTAYSGELSSGENFAVLSLELYAMSSGIAFYVDDFPFECMAGHWSLARTASAPAQKTCASVKTIAEKQDVVRNDRFVMEYLAF